MRLSILFPALLACGPAFAAPKVVADLPVTQSLSALVMGDLGTPALLTPPGTDPHHAQLKPSQANVLSNAEVVVWIGAALTPWLSGPMESLASEAVKLELLESDGTDLRMFGGDMHEDHADHDEAHADHDDHDHEDHDHSGIDPHAWLSPENASIWLTNIAETLAEADPQNAATYRANAETARVELASLSEELTATLAPVRGLRLIFAHDSMGYFTDAFGLTDAGAIAEGDAAAPGAARLSALRAQIEPAAQTCVFTEPQHSPAQALAIRAEFPDVGGGDLDPTGGEQTPGPGLYAATMRALAATIAECRVK